MDTKIAAEKLSEMFPKEDVLFGVAGDVIYAYVQKKAVLNNVPTEFQGHVIIKKFVGKIKPLID